MANKSKKSKNSSWKDYTRLEKIYPYLLMFFGATGLLASAALIIEKIQILREPATELICNINPVYSCSNVIASEQSEILGFPNELMGMVLFSAIITFAVLLASGVDVKKWIWKLFMAGMIGSMAFVVWFFYQSVYTIGSLCIFCSIVWFSLWAITASTFAWVYDHKLIRFPAGYEKIVAFKRRYIVYIWLAFILTLAGLILNHFWYYYGDKLGF